MQYTESSIGVDLVGVDSSERYFIRHFATKEQAEDARMARLEIDPDEVLLVCSSRR